MSKVTGINQTFYHQPVGSNLDVANEHWRGFAALPDVFAGDFYSDFSPNDSQGGRYGIWHYERYTKRLRYLAEDRCPVWNIIETASEIPGKPTPEDTVKKCWASLIGGADGLIFFDHRFGEGGFVTPDFAAMLHTPALKAAVSAFIVQATALADALHSPEAELCTAHTSSNTTEGPYGGTLGVRMLFTTRDTGAKQYLFAMGGTPGATTATFTLPDWAGETVTVIDESRTVIVDGGGVLEDDFAADYEVHLYERTV